MGLGVPRSHTRSPLRGRAFRCNLFLNAQNANAEKGFPLQSLTLMVFK